MNNQEFNKSRDAASYNKQADDYGKYIERLSAPLAEYICKIARLKSGDNVLDVGTGPGIAARRAAQIVAPDGNVLGIDLSEGMIDTAKKSVAKWTGKPPEFRVMDAESLDLSDAAFDAVISLCAVRHFPNISKALTEMRRVLKPGGHLVVSFGYVRPIAPLPLGFYIARRLLDKFLQPVRPQIVGTVYLTQMAKKMLPEPTQVIATDWGEHNPRGSLVQVVREAGFEQVEASWNGHELEFESAEEFWEAQTAIVTEIRKRLVEASPEAVNQLKQTFLKEAESILRRGGKLTYPYGAFYVSGSNPMT